MCKAMDLEDGECPGVAEGEGPASEHILRVPENDMAPSGLRRALAAWQQSGAGGEIKDKTRWERLAVLGGRWGCSGPGQWQGGCSFE